MDLIQRVTSLKKQLEGIQTNRSRKEGALTERLRDLKELCGSSDIKEAKACLEKLKKEKVKSEKRLEKALDVFEEKYADLIAE